jgi:hypothetical protein
VILENLHVTQIPSSKFISVWRKNRFLLLCLEKIWSIISIRTVSSKNCFINLIFILIICNLTYLVFVFPSY